MLKALHAAICSPKGQASAEGGIGVALGSETVNVKGKPVKMYKVAQLASSGPAAGSGAVQAGDYILEVDGRKLAGMLSKDVRALIRGPAGSAVKLRAQVRIISGTKVLELVVLKFLFFEGTAPRHWGLGRPLRSVSGARQRRSG